MGSMSSMGIVATSQLAYDFKYTPRCPIPCQRGHTSGV